MLFTGIDGKKRFSVNWSLLKRSWEVSKKEGRRIYVVPSHLTYVRIEETDIKDTYDLRRFLSLEIEEKFGDVLWDVRLSGNRYCLALIRDFNMPEDAYAFDPEPFSLARAAKALGETDCWILDLGKRKTTLVKLSKGELSGYRVILKGGDFIDREVSEKLGVELEEARALKIKEGLGNEVVRDAFEKIVSSLGKDVIDRKILLSGGGSRLKGIDEVLPKAVRKREVEPELFSAFGASLKFVVKDCSPDFREEELSDRDFRRVALIFGTSLLLFVGVNLSLNFIEKGIVKEVRNAERDAFRRVFPNLPPVAVRDQLKSMVGSEHFSAMKKMISLSEKLPEGIKIYRIEFVGGKLKVVGEVRSKDKIIELKPKVLRETPEKTYEFEVEL